MGSANISEGDGFNIHIFNDSELRERDINRQILLKFSCKEDVFIEEIIQFMNDDHIGMKSSLTHELKHEFDKEFLDKELMINSIDYQIFNGLRTGIPPFDNLLFNLYFFNKVENKVRNSEVMSIISNSNITKSEFKNFLKDNRVYQKVKEIKNYDFEEIREDMLKNVDAIREHYDDLSNEKDDNSVVDKKIYTLVEFVMSNRIEQLKQSIISKRIDPMEMLLKVFSNRDIKNPLNDEETKIMNKIINKSIFYNENPVKYLENTQKILKLAADKVLRGLGKLYDMCKDDPETDKSMLNKKINMKAKNENIETFWTVQFPNRKKETKYDTNRFDRITKKK